MCPDPEVIAAFIAGSASDEERTLLVEHLSACDNCLVEIGEVVKCESEGGVVPMPNRSRSRVTWWLSAAAALFAMVTSLIRVLPPMTETSMALLIDAARSADRPIEPRLSGGFAWTPLRRALRGGGELDASRLKLIGAAGRVLERTAKDDSAGEKHAAAIAHVFAGHTDEGVKLLAEVAATTKDPRILSNLAALLYVQGVEAYDQSRLLQSLAAADAALRFDPTFPEALFNRALVLERLDMSEHARHAWRRYLAVDPASPWAAEARHHLTELDTELDEETNSAASATAPIEFGSRAGAVPSAAARSRALFEEAVSAALSCAEVTRAFEYTERSRTSRPIGVSMLSASLSRDDIILQYLALPSRLITFVVAPDRVRAVQTNVPREVLSKEIAAMAHSATTANESQLAAAASTLYTRLIAPVAGDLAPGRRLIIVTDDLLSDVPFAALRSPNGQYIIENHSVVMTPSASTFVRLMTSFRPSTESPRLLLVAGPSREDTGLSRLFFAGREVNAIAKVYGSRAERLIIEDDSTLQSAAATADVIHFAGHAFTPEGLNEPALVTFGKRDTTSYLVASEIAAMRLPHTRAVVLAACNTGRSVNSRATGPLSLANAFLEAGAHSVVATLWPIDDQAASEFYPRLHHHLARGLPTADALRATQLEWIHRGGTSSNIWAAVQAIGS